VAEGASISSVSGELTKRRSAFGGGSPVMKRRSNRVFG